MSYDSLLIDTVTVFNPSSDSEDRYGNPIQELDDGTVERARVQQMAADEDLRDRDTRVTRYRVFLISDTTATSLSVIEWNGRQHRVVGEPAKVADGIGVHHVEAAMEGIEG